MSKEKKLSNDELKGFLRMWRVGCKHDTEEVYENCKICPSKKECKQAEKQFRHLIESSAQEPSEENKDLFDRLEAMYSYVMARISKEERKGFALRYRRLRQLIIEAQAEPSEAELEELIIKYEKGLNATINEIRHGVEPDSDDWEYEIFSDFKKEYDELRRGTK